MNGAVVKERAVALSIMCDSAAPISALVAVVKIFIIAVNPLAFFRKKG